MNLGLVELRRRPGRFTVVGLALTLIVTLLVLLGGLLDGLILGTTGALRSQQADLIVFQAGSRESVLRSRLTSDEREVVEGVEGVRAVGGLGVVLLAASVPGADDLADVAVLGYEIPAAGMPEPPSPGTAYADRSLEGDGVTTGSELRVGPAGVPVKVVGWVSGTNYVGQGALWVSPATWRQVQNRNRPDQAVADGVFQVLVVQAAGDPADLAARIDDATDARTTTLTTQAAADAMPGVRAQTQVMTGLIGVTLAVAGLVAALFFALLLIERTALYAGLKALGASSTTLAVGIVVQSVTVAVVACGLGGVLSMIITLVLPESVVVDLRLSRFVVSAALVLASAALGALVSLRRIIRIEPASALT
jgi:putative ABC transport system permease protein